MTRTTEVVRTSELQLGDVVWCHGLRCLIDRPLQVSKSHPGSDTRFTQALVLNRDEVPSEVVPRGWTADWDRSCSWGDAKPHNGEHRWTIQGNDLARWEVERVARCGAWHEHPERHCERGSVDCGCGWGSLCDAPR